MRRARYIELQQSEADRVEAGRGKATQVESTRASGQEKELEYVGRGGAAPIDVTRIRPLFIFQNACVRHSS